VVAPLLIKYINVSLLIPAPYGGCEPLLTLTATTVGRLSPVDTDSTPKSGTGDTQLRILFVNVSRPFAENNSGSTPTIVPSFRRL
jgi:hypothetical protein